MRAGAHPALCARVKGPLWNMCCGRRAMADEAASVAAEATGRGASRYTSVMSHSKLHASWLRTAATTCQPRWGKGQVGV